MNRWNSCPFVSIRGSIIPPFVYFRVFRGSSTPQRTHGDSAVRARSSAPTTHYLLLSSPYSLLCTTFSPLLPILYENEFTARQEIVLRLRWMPAGLSAWMHIHGSRLRGIPISANLPGEMRRLRTMRRRLSRSPGTVYATCLSGKPGCARQLCGKSQRQGGLEEEFFRRFVLSICTQSSYRWLGSGGRPMGRRFRLCRL